MNNTISSGGLAYVYFNGYEENGLLYIETVDSYRYLADAFYEQVMERSAAAEKEVEAVHIFAVPGIKERAHEIYNLVEEELKENFQRILNGTDIVKFSDKLDKTGNAFFTCVQEFFCEYPVHFPRQSFCEFENWMLAGVCCSGMQDEALDLLADEIVSLWLTREEPCLCGKQMMLRSFFLSDIVGYCRHPAKRDGRVESCLRGWTPSFHGNVLFLYKRNRASERARRTFLLKSADR